MRVKERGRGEMETKRERTVADLSAELRHSWRKRPLSFDCELNHEYPQMTQHTEGGVRVKWVMSCRLRLY